MSDEPKPVEAPKEAPKEVFHIIWVDNNQSFDEDGDIPVVHHKSAVGRQELELALRGILSEYAENMQIRIFRGEEVVMAPPARRSLLAATVTYPDGKSCVVTIG